MRTRSKLPIVALIYDFDGTLAAGNMQEYSFIESVGEKKEDFWGQTAVMAQEQDSDNVLVYMLLMLEKAKERGISIKRESLKKYGEDVKLFKEHIGPNVKIKAAGGVSSLEDLETFIELGCDRIGTSRAIGLCKGQITKGY